MTSITRSMTNQATENWRNGKYIFHEDHTKAHICIQNGNFHFNTDGLLVIMYSEHDDESHDTLDDSISSECILTNKQMSQIIDNVLVHVEQRDELIQKLKKDILVLESSIQTLKAKPRYLHFFVLLLYFIIILIPVIISLIYFEIAYELNENFSV